MLIACGSASESSTPGDEPLGIITSLLCAGASSVIGTLWKVEARQGMNFSRRIYDMLLSEAKTVTELRASEGLSESANNNEMFINLAINFARSGLQDEEEPRLSRAFSVGTVHFVRVMVCEA